MRIGLLLTGAALLAGCAPSAPPMEATPQAQARLAQLLAGHVAGQPQACIDTFAPKDMIVINDNTVLFKSGSRYYRNDFGGLSCNNLSSPGSALVTKSSSTQLCRGDIATVRDGTGMVIGSCAFGDFTPYLKP